MYASSTQKILTKIRINVIFLKKDILIYLCIKKKL